METKTITVCTALHVDVDCERNDTTDIKCGGPALLGYDFFVSPDEDRDGLHTFIKACLKKYHRPLIGVCISPRKNFPVEDLWTREMIEKCIKENAI